VDTESVIEEFQNAKKNDDPYKIFRSVFNISQDLDYILNFVKNTPDGEYRHQAEYLHILQGIQKDTMPIDNIYSFFNLIKDSYSENYNPDNALAIIVCEKGILEYDGITGVNEHFDPQDNIHWNCIGKSSWIINKKDEIILNPGDIIFIKAGTYHSVKTLEPRVGIIFTA
jgi:hypothetical protein